MKCVGKRHDGQPCSQSVGISRRTGRCRHHDTREAQGIRILTEADIFMGDDGILILDRPIQTDEGPVSIIPIIREGDDLCGTPLKWADERPLCRHVQDFLHKGTEPPGAKCTAYKDGMCRAANLGGSLPCLFHEEPDSEGWQRARQYERIPCPTDTDPEGWALAQREYVYHPVWNGRELEPMFATGAEEAIKKAINRVRGQFDIPGHVSLAALVQIPSNVVRVFARSEDQESRKTKAASPADGSAA
jgi:hypothetical protein